MSKETTKTSMYSFIFQRFDEKQNMPAVGFLHRMFSFKRLKRETDAAACAMLKNGLKKGDVVTMALPNIPSAVSLFYGANKIGVIVNLVHPLAPYAQLKETMDKTNSKMLFSMDVVLDKYVVQAVKDGVKIICCSASDWLKFPESTLVAAFGKTPVKNVRRCRNEIKFAKDFLKTEQFEVQPDDESWDEPRVIMHSSGTSDNPKSVMLTNRAFNTQAYFTIEVLPEGRDILGGTAMLTALPMFHGFGLGVTFHTVLSYGHPAVLVPKFSPKIMVKKMRRNKSIALIAGVPTMFNSLVHQEGFDGPHLARMEFAFCGGDKVNPNLKAKFDEAMIKWNSRCRLDEGYGLTEAVSVISVNRRGIEREGSVGKALGDYRVEAFDPETQQLLERGKLGEIAVCGDIAMKGYVDNNCSSAFLEWKGDRFVRTGDLGYVDEDGFIFIKSRIKRMVKISGINTYPAEAEQMICKVKGVQHCCVVARSHPHKGSELVAFLVKDRNANEAELLEQIKALCTEKLDKWTNPRAFKFVEAMPLTNNGKPDYKTLEAQAEEMPR